MKILANKKILLGVSASIAAYKSILLLRELQELGAEVRVVMTPSAEEMIGSATFVALTRCEVLVKEQSTQDYFTHIDWARWADLFILGPATANSINTIATGLTPNALSLLWLAFDRAKMVIPAMNPTMLSNSNTQESLSKLKRHGVQVVDPEVGLMACGEVGEGRYPDVSVITESIESLLLPKTEKASVLLTAGRTEESIDPVRYISNRSSGSMALAIAKKYRSQGHPVTVISGPCDVKWPSWVEVHEVKSSMQMYQKVDELSASHEVFISNAAVADFRPKTVSDEKIKGSRDQLIIELVPNPDILKTVSQNLNSNQISIGFALETTDPLNMAQQKLESKGCDLLVLNLPVDNAGAFSSASMEVAIFDKKQKETPSLKILNRTEVADALYVAYEKYVKEMA
jgi:phosphopantothenoylcysteine decarboxylase/phosphopantothenate--cysteine ligase